jgi:diaminopropionate ammonia-lyase
VQAAVAENGWTIISDTSWEGYETTPRSVMRGYTVLVEEVDRQWRPGRRMSSCRPASAGWPPR